MTECIQLKGFWWPEESLATEVGTDVTAGGKRTKISVQSTSCERKRGESLSRKSQLYFTGSERHPKASSGTAKLVGREKTSPAGKKRQSP